LKRQLPERQVAFFCGYCMNKELVNQMNRKDFTVIAIRLMAIYLALTAVSSLMPTFGMAFMVFFDSSDSSSQLFTVVGSSFGLFYLIACGILWPLAPKVADRIERDLPPEEVKEKSNDNYSNFLVIGLTLLGFLVLSDAIPTLVKIITAILLPSFDANYAKVLSSLNAEKVTVIPWSDIIYLITQLLIGAWFIFGSSGIVAFLKKVRYAGRNHSAT
jgi:hypothetical protein